MARPDWYGKDARRKLVNAYHFRKRCGMSDEWRYFGEFEDWALSNGWGPGKSIVRPDVSRPWGPGNARVADGHVRSRCRYGGGYRRVRCYSEDGELAGEFDTVRDAAVWLAALQGWESVDSAYTRIYLATVRNKRSRKCGGYVWEAVGSDA